ncbi:hypothetical protein Aasi_0811 [Candidatus Amoebophilus asiaticus 5a2]|uniref:Uncharacterized protein n=1 Tax=Amoebophilus asiaticus (strain 5a2) TaxID=452471 RepID=B3ESI4_AMOA5|nr:hypothetical protein Aasi_0811 [Candidatus Amoebophilus asiaticus 5a2]
MLNITNEEGLKVLEQLLMKAIRYYHHVPTIKVLLANKTVNVNNLSC